MTTRDPEKLPPRRQDSNFLDQLFYRYTNPIISYGYKKDLETQNYPNIEDMDCAKRLSFQYQEAWDDQLQVSWPQYSLCGLFFAIETLAKLGEGYFLSLLLNWFRDSAASSVDAYLYTLYLSLSVFAHGILHHLEFFYGMRVGMQVRIGLTTLIYNKCLSLPISYTSSTGMIVNLISNDVQRFEGYFNLTKDASPFMNALWVGPIELCIFWYFIYLQIGFASFAAIGGIITLLPLQGIFANMFRKLRQVTVDIRDERIKNISDMLAGILIVKFYAWEIPFIAKINSLRTNEMNYIKKSAVLKAINQSIFFTAAVTLQLFAFGTFWLIGGEFTPARIFSSITYIATIQLTMTMFFPTAVQLGSECIVSLKRIREFILLPEITHSALDINSESCITMENASFSWSKEISSSENNDVLHNLSLSIPQSYHVAIIGQVGSGKSSLLQAILGELPLSTGSLHIPTRKFSYASQTPWIISGSIKQNILFGNEYDPERFRKVIRVCALESDLARLPERENTLLGERGVNLSGGQKSRIALCRAIYHEADIYLFDDPLSAVDSIVGRQIFEEGIQKFLHGKCVLLVTHQIQFVQSFEHILLLSGGTIVAQGTYEQVLSNDNLIKMLNPKKTEDSETEDANEFYLAADAPQSDEFSKEEQFKGSVQPIIFISYFKSGSGLMMLVLMIILLVATEGCLVAASFWLATWTSLNYSDQRLYIYPVVFLVLVIGTFSLSKIRAVTFYMMCIKSSRNLFVRMLQSVVRTPISFFHSTAHDMSLTDEMLPQTFFDFLQCAIHICGIFLLSAIIIPISLILVPIIGFLFYKLRAYFIASQRQIKRMESVTRSPVYGNIPSTLEGLSTIRAFTAAERFRDKFFAVQDSHTRVYFTFISSGRWLGIRLDMIGASLVTVIAFACVGLRGWLQLNPGLLGLLLSSLIGLIGLLQWAVRQSAEVETLMISTERIFEYAELEPEAPDVTKLKVPTDWPSSGEVEFQKMSLAYPILGKQQKKIVSKVEEKLKDDGIAVLLLENGAPTLNTLNHASVLKNITLSIKAGSKVGIVGRTGAGKSSLLQALFRLVEPFPKGCIKIDGIETSELGLNDLRSRITIIPQEPFCFGGTIRFNIDPFNVYTDLKIWNALESVSLKTKVNATPGQLEGILAENGSNWSVGERQLLCLARALLRTSKICVMDEATSSVDIKTDNLIQGMIRGEDGLFSHATVLTIAHRISTVIDYDKIMVLDEGRLVEFGHPWELLSKAEGDESAFFLRMVNEMGVEAKKELCEIAKKCYVEQ